MTQLNADAIITLTSAIPALFLASLSAWLAYLTLRRRNISRNDVEREAIGFFVSQASTAPPSLEMHPAPSQASTTFSLLNKNFPQIQFPPVALLGDFERTPRQPPLLPSILSDEQNQTVEE